MAKSLKRGKGTGTVYKMSNRRRNPWRAVITTGWMPNTNTEKVVQKRVTIGYYETKDAAMKALLQYNEDPYDIKLDRITFTEAYENWTAKHFQHLDNPSSIRTIKAAYTHSSPLHNMRFKDIRAFHLEDTIKEANVGDSTKTKMKSLYNQLFRYALKYGFAEEDHTRYMSPITYAASKERVPFLDDEIQLLWDHLYDVPFVDMILVGIYSGWRPDELASLKTCDIDFDEQTMLGGKKTDSGRDRYVPIHPLIMPLIKKRYNCNNEYLFNDDVPNGKSGKHLTYYMYRNRFKDVMSRLGLTHTPHETRHTFITKAKQTDEEMNEYILKLIVGHKIADITERVYTHRTKQEMYNEIIKIKK